MTHDLWIRDIFGFKTDMCNLDFYIAIMTQIVSVSVFWKGSHEKHQSCKDFECQSNLQRAENHSLNLNEDTYQPTADRTPQSIHPSSFYTHWSCSGSQGAGTDPSMHWVKGGILPSQANLHRQTNTSTLTFTLLSVLNLNVFGLSQATYRDTTIQLMISKHEVISFMPI